MIADGIFPRRVVTMVAGVVVVKDETQTARTACIGYFSNQVALRGASGGHAINRCTGRRLTVGRAWHEVKMMYSRAGSGGLTDVALRVKVIDGFLEGQPIVFPNRLRLRRPMR